MSRDDVLAAWPAPSSQGTTVYEVVLKRDGALSCNCPGWVYARRGQPRSCKHTKDHEVDVAKILAAVAAGKPVPKLKTVAVPEVSLQGLKAAASAARRKAPKDDHDVAVRLRNVEFGD